MESYTCMYCSKKFVAERVRDLRGHDCPEALADDARLGTKVARFDPVFPEIENEFEEVVIHKLCSSKDASGI
jgi:hypothetical protein